mgnify:CR=1 FL=1|jgi:Fur family ferric uptake transcriptional regulator
MSGKDTYKDLLKTGNLKSTKHRNALLETLEQSGLPLTAEELFLRLKEKNVSISLSTVYRILETLVDKGFVIRSQLATGNKALYELSHKDHHHHLHCVRCRQIFPVDGCPLEDYEQLLADRFGFTVTGHNLEVFGYCEKCKDHKQDG